MANNLLSLEGQQFGCLIVISYDESSKGSNDSFWNWECKNCGGTGSSRGQSIKQCRKSCIHCKMQKREYPSKEVKCLTCSSVFLTRNNAIRGPTCSLACRKALITKRAANRRKDTIVNYLKSLQNSIKCRAKRRNFEYDLPTSYLVDLYNKQQGKCARTQVLLIGTDSPGKSTINKHTASVDRIDPDKGYTKDNIELVSYICNVAKNYFNHEELYEFCKAYSNLYEQGLGSKE
ncbi:hypothetical protein [Xanthomonas phage DES1]|nr:hypothetical protein [Xanthomonas phage DES1]